LNHHMEILPVLLIGGIVLTLSILTPIGLHKIEEGHVGVYWRGGAILNIISDPGYHVKLPITVVKSVQVTIQTDQVLNIPCGTSGGVMLYFDKIEVVNRLRRDAVYETIKNYTINYDKTWIYDKIHHSINEFCSLHTLQEVYIDLFDQIDESMLKSLQTVCNVWAPGIEIVAVRVTKPRIPDSIRDDFEAMEAEKTKLLIASQKQRADEKLAQTEKQRAIAQSEKELAVSKITMEKEIAEKEKEREMSFIEDQVFLAQEKGYADALYYQALKEAESNLLMLSPAFLQIEKIKALSSQATIIYGDSIPNALGQNPVLIQK